MADFDVFNGDADGICALLQLRIARLGKAQLQQRTNAVGRAMRNS